MLGLTRIAAATTALHGAIHPPNSFPIGTGASSATNKHVSRTSGRRTRAINPDDSPDGWVPEERERLGVARRVKPEPEAEYLDLAAELCQLCRRGCISCLRKDLGSHNHGAWHQSTTARCRYAPSQALSLWYRQR